MAGFGSIPLQKSNSGGIGQQIKVSIPKKGNAISKGGISVAKKAPAVIQPSALESMDALSEFLGNNSDDRIVKVEKLLETLSSEDTDNKKKNATNDLIIIANNLGLGTVEGYHMTTYIINEITKSSGIAVKNGGYGGLLLLNALLEDKVQCNTIEPFILPHFNSLLNLATDKSQGVRDMSRICCDNLMRTCNPFMFRMIFPEIIKGITSDDWRIRVMSLSALKEISPHVSVQMSPYLSSLIPICTECVINSKTQVQAIAIHALTEACKCITNDDIRHLVPQLVSVIAHPEESLKTIELLIETVFVQNVDGSTLALIAPTLGKVLKGRSSPLKRKAAKIIDSMCRLVQEPSHVAPFVPMLLPFLDRAIDEVPDAEVVEVCTAAREVLLNAIGQGGVSMDDDPSLAAPDLIRVTSQESFNEVKAKAISGEGPASNIGLDALEVSRNMKSALKEISPIENVVDKQVDTINKYVADTLSQLLAYYTMENPVVSANASDHWRSVIAMTKHSDWKSCIAPYVSSMLYGSVTSDKNINSVSEDFASNLRLVALGEIKDLQNEDEEDPNQICNVEFSLAFGSKVLLQNTKLKLIRGHNYGLMGKNGVGKTTLLTNIGNGAIEAMPTHLKCVYVQHEDARDDKGVAMIDELLLEKDLEGVNVTREDAIAALKKIAFTDEMISSPRSSLSGGWKMKLIMTKAVLAQADILLLDEPTNHLDKASVGWLEDYIRGEQNITCLIVSHDTGFLDRVISDVIHYEGKNLVYYPGNLTSFVDIHPEAKYYYDLEKSDLKFVFPVPEKLDGIASSTKSVMYAKGVNFTYPGAKKPQLTDVDVKVCLGSRIAVLGANGAGKSTLIKMLVKETKPDCGDVWSHMNLRVAYVAQHSFHHIEEHIDKSPVDYMKWRFGQGVDKESLQKETIALASEEIKNIAENIKYGDVTDVISRRKNGKYLEYEIKFHGQTHRDPNKYFTREKMLELGHSKLVDQMDIKVAAMAAGLDVRPILISEIQGHLDNFALDAEFGTHSIIRRLSGGQKVKLVLAAAMWNKPHLLVLDEPTNYLDREALGALTTAIKGFAGGVMIISHNSEFTDAICTEKWNVADGKCVVEGEAEETTLRAFDKNNKIRKSKSNNSLPKENANDLGHKGAGCTNGNVVIVEQLMNPKRLEALTSKEEKKLGRLAAVAGKSLKDYITGITSASPEWKWL